MTDYVLYDVFAPLGERGGKRVAVFAEASGDLQARAAQAKAPLSVFIASQEFARLSLRVFTPTREKGESDSASLAALTYAHEHGLESDLADVVSGPGRAEAQLCGNGDWLLEQGVVNVQPVVADLSSLNLPAVGAMHVASTARPNLTLELPTLKSLDDFLPDAEAISEVNRATDTTGLILYTLQAPAAGAQRRADLSFRCFGPQRGFLEDAASSNMLACLTGVLNARELLRDKDNVLRAAQRKPGHLAMLTAHFGRPQDRVWVGGRAVVADETRISV